jgi:hypothetical protein
MRYAHVEHGAAFFLAHNPQRLGDLYRTLAVYEIAAGERSRGLFSAARALRHHPRSWKVWAAAALTTLPRTVAARAVRR